MVNAMFTFAATALSKLSTDGTLPGRTFRHHRRLLRSYAFAKGALLPPRGGILPR